MNLVTFGILPAYTVLAVTAVVIVVLVELIWLRTGILRSGTYWATIAIVLAFQVLVDGWLTKLDDPIVIYHADAITGVRFPWDVPIEDYGFGFAMVTTVILAWEVAARRERRRTTEQAP